MKQPTFNLIDQPWIPCVRLDGRVEELGLMDTLLQAHQLQGLGGDSPLVTAALYRLLLAILYRAVGPPPHDEAWEKLWRAGRWNAERIGPYLERWRDRFDLFHPEHPFYQWQGRNSKVKSVNQMLFDVASGNNATLFDHHTDIDSVYLSPQTASRVLLAVQALSPAGTGGLAPKDSANAPWATGAIFLAEGKTLFDTLAFNLMPASFWGDAFSGTNDLPVWESDDPLTPERSAPLGITDYLTWPNRSIRFIPEWHSQELVVPEAEMGSGLKLDGLLDPFKHYRIDKQRGHIPLRFSEYKALWRDSASLLRFQRTRTDVRAPRVLDWMATLLENEALPATYPYRLMALGMASNKAKIEFYREEHMPLPAEYLQDESLVDKLSVAIAQADEVRKILMRAISRLATLVISPTADAPDGRKPDKKDVNNLMGHWATERFYWAELEPAFFQLLENLPKNPDEASARWLNALIATAENAFTRTETALPDDARGLRAAVRGRGQLMGGLKKFREETSQQEVTHDSN